MGADMLFQLYCSFLLDNFTTAGKLLIFATKIFWKSNNGQIAKFTKTTYEILQRKQPSFLEQTTIVQINKKERKRDSKLMRAAVQQTF